MENQVYLSKQFYQCPFLNKSWVFECCKVQVGILRYSKLHNGLMAKPWVGLKGLSPRNRFDLHASCGAVLWWLSLLYSFIHHSLNSGSAQVQILVMKCHVPDSEDLWQWFRLQIKLNSFYWSTIHKNKSSNK